MDNINALTQLLTGITADELVTIHPYVVQRVNGLLPSPYSHSHSTKEHVQILRAFIALSIQFTKTFIRSFATTSSPNDNSHALSDRVATSLDVLGINEQLDIFIIERINTISTARKAYSATAALRHCEARLLFQSYARGLQIAGRSLRKEIDDDVQAVIRGIRMTTGSIETTDHECEEIVEILETLVSIRQLLNELSCSSAFLSPVIGRYADAVGSMFHLGDIEVDASMTKKDNVGTSSFVFPGRMLIFPSKQTDSENKVLEVGKQGTETRPIPKINITPKRPLSSSSAKPAGKKSDSSSATLQKQGSDTNAAPPVRIEGSTSPLLAKLTSTTESSSPTTMDYPASPMSVDHESTSSPAPPTNPLASLFAERASRLEARERQSRLSEREEARAKARAREAAIAADPTKAEQRKHADEMKAKLQKEKEAKELIRLRIESDKRDRKEKFEQERIRRHDGGNVGRGVKVFLKKGGEVRSLTKEEARREELETIRQYQDGDDDDDYEPGDDEEEADE